MALPAQQRQTSAEEYLALERASSERHEFVEGEIFAMTGASRKHNLLSGNSFAALHGQLKDRPCEIYNNDMRVKINADGAYVYPDIVAVCEAPQLEDEQLDTLLNPALVIEVLSESTEAYDRGMKFNAYRKLESLQEYLLVSQDKVQIEHYRRQHDGQWLLADYTDLNDTLELAAIGCRLDLADVYAKVET